MDFIFGNHKGEERFTFNVQVHCVQPWVQLKSKGKSDEGTQLGFILKWNRDNKRSGTSKVAFLEPGDAGNSEESVPLGLIQFNELFDIPATLHKEQGGHKSPSRTADADGHFWQKKTVILTLHDATSDGQPKEPPLGRGVLDLAEYAAGGNDVMPVSKFLKIRLAVSKQIEKANGGQHIHIDVAITCLSTKTKKAGLFERSRSLRDDIQKPELRKSKSELKPKGALSLSRSAVQPVSEEVDQDLIDSLLESEGEGEESDGEQSHQSEHRRDTRNNVAASEVAGEGGDQSEGEKSGTADVADDDSDLDFMTEDDFEPTKPSTTKAPPLSSNRTPNGSSPSSHANSPSRTASKTPDSTPDRKASRAPAKSELPLPAPKLEPAKGSKLGVEVKSAEANGRGAGAQSVVQQKAVPVQQSVAPPHSDYGEGVSDGAVVSAAVGKAGMTVPQGKPVALKSRPGTETGKMSMAVLDAAERVRVAVDRATQAEARALKLEAELRDCAVLEVAIHTVVSVHGQTAHKVHAPARRLARAYVNARRNGLWPPEIAAATAQNSVAGLILAARACGDDVSRLVFWWSNCVVLREMVATAFDIEMRIAEDRKRTESVSTSAANAAPKLSAEIREAERILNQSSGRTAATRDAPPKTAVSRGVTESKRDEVSTSDADASKGAAKPGGGWKTAAAYCDALSRTEAWICGKVLQLLWWQLMNPPMQPGFKKKADMNRVCDVSTPPPPKKELIIDVSKVPIGRTDRAPPSKGPKIDRKGQIFGSNGKVVGFKNKSDNKTPIASPRAASVDADVSDGGEGSPSGSGVKTPASSRTRRTLGEGRDSPDEGGPSPSGRDETGNASPETRSGTGNGIGNGNGNGMGPKDRKVGSRGGLGCEESPLECVELWKGVLREVEKLCCPARAEGRECGCLHVLTQQVLEHCIARLDVALFNALLRDPRIDGPTDPISDPLTEASALPIPAGRLTFGGGVQLKIAVKAWADWLPLLLSGSLFSGSDSVRSPSSPLASKAPPSSEPFPYLRGAADLLMLPKEMLMDRAVRKEVCGPLTLPLIRRILYLFVPDYHAPEPVPAALLAAFNAEVSMEKRRKGEADLGPSYLYNAPAAPCTYAAAPSSLVRALFGKDCAADAALDARGYSSDDDLDQAERPLQLLVEKVVETGGKEDVACETEGDESREKEARESEREAVQRYHLLRRVWQPAR